MKNFKCCAISLNILQAGGLCEELEFTAPLQFYMNNPKNSEVNIFFEQCFACPSCTSSNKETTFGYLIDMEVAYKPY